MNTNVRRVIRRMAAPVAFVGLGIALFNGAGVASADSNDTSGSPARASHATSADSPAKRTGRAPTKPTAPNATRNTQQKSKAAAAVRDSEGVATAAPQAKPSTPVVPAAPASDPIAEALTWISHELGQALVSRTPTVAVTFQDDGNGVVTGALNATDPGGNPLTYHVISPPNQGDVEVAADGTWTYTSKPDVPGLEDDPAAIADTFSVVVDNGRRSLFQIDDTGFHLSLFGSTGQTTVPINLAEGEPQFRAAPTPAGLYAVNVVNLSSRILVLSGYDTLSAPDNNPDIGTITYPGQSIQFTIPWSPTDRAVVRPLLTTLGTNGYYSLELVNPGTGPDPTVRCTAGNGACTPITATVTNQVLLMDPPGTKVNVPANRAELQSDILNLCGKFGSACTFKPKGKATQAGFGAATRLEGFYPVINTGTQNSTTTYTNSEATATSTSWTVGLNQKLVLFKLIEFSFAQTVGQTVTTTYTFEQTTTVPVRPGHTVFLFMTVPILRASGDWEVKVGNTTWTLQDVWADLPDPNRKDDALLEAYDCETGSARCESLWAGKIPPNSPAAPASAAATKPEDGAT